MNTSHLPAKSYIRDVIWTSHQPITRAEVQAVLINLFGETEARAMYPAQFAA